MRIHEHPLRVIYAHTDKAGVVYYGNYLTFFEIGRTEYFRSLGKSYAAFEEEGILLTVAEASCKYHAPAEYDDLLTIRTWISRVRRTRIDFEYEVKRGETLLCSGSTVLACISTATRRPAELPHTMCRLLEGCV